MSSGHLDILKLATMALDGTGPETMREYGLERKIHDWVE
jgi:hypothetical protein